MFPSTMTFVPGTPPTVTAAPSSKSIPWAETCWPPIGSPKRGAVLTTRRCEISEVLPCGSVAVAEMRAPGSIVTFGSVTSIAAMFEPFVVTCVEPIQVSPSTKSNGNRPHAGFE